MGFIDIIILIVFVVVFFIGGIAYTIYDAYDTITTASSYLDCCYIWWYCLVNDILFGINATAGLIQCIIENCCFRGEEKETRRMKYLRIVIIVAIIIFIWGLLLQLLMPTECRNHYINDVPELWFSFNFTFWIYSSTLGLSLIIFIIYMIAKTVRMYQLKKEVKQIMADKRAYLSSRSLGIRNGE